MTGSHLSDDARILTVPVLFYSFENRLSILRSDKSNQFPFIGNIQRIKTKQFTDSFHFIFQGYGILIDCDADAGLNCNLVQSGSDPPSGGISKYMDACTCRKHSVNHPVQRRRIAHDGSIK